MRKLGVDEWLMADVMYLNSRSVVKINSTISESFDVKVGVHQGSVLSSVSRSQNGTPLGVIIIMQMTL